MLPCGEPLPHAAVTKGFRGNTRWNTPKDTGVPYGSGLDLQLQPWVNRFAFKRKHTEDSLMHAAQRFFSSKTFE